MTEPEEKPPHQDQAGGDAGKSRRVLGLSFEALSLIFDGIIAIAAIIGSFFVYRQLAAMNDQLAVMREQMADARSAAKATDVTTDRQLKIAEKQASSQKTLADANKDIAAAATKSAKATEQLAVATSKAADASRSLAESAADANVATHRLADAALDANSVTRELVKTTQQAIDTNKGISRAFVFAKGVELHEVYMSNILGAVIKGGQSRIQSWIISVQLENTGSTPTQDLTVTSSCWETYGRKLLDRASDAPGFDVCAIDPKDPWLESHAIVSMVLAPKQIRPFGGCQIKATGLLMNELGALPLYYTFGTVRYRDIFNPSYIHRTEYCFVVTLTGSAYELGLPAGRRGEKMPPLGILATPCQQHNCADEECNGQSPLP